MRILLTIFFFLYTLICFGVDPDRKYVDHPMNSNIQVESVEITTPDNYVLKSWICFPDEKVNQNRVLVLAYGDTGNMSYWIRQVLEMVNKGYTVVMFDYRGFGESSDFEMQAQQLYYDEFTTDLVSVIQYVKERFKQPVGVWALSMGTISAVFAYNIENYHYLIAEGFVASPIEVVKVIDQYLEKQYTLPESAQNYDKALSRLNLPVLYFTGNKDGLTPPQDSYRAKYLNPRSNVVLFKGGHLQGFQALSLDYHGQRYIEYVNSFCDNLY
ncbi:alpha/beta hydrolase family protein [Myroides sp. LJL115]